MRKIDTTSDNYNFVANLFSTMVGFGASCLVGAFCNSIIENDPNYGKHRFSMTHRLRFVRTLTTLQMLGTKSWIFCQSVKRLAMFIRL